MTIQKEIKNKLYDERQKKTRQIYLYETKVIPILSMRMSEISNDLDDHQDIIMDEYYTRNNRI